MNAKTGDDRGQKRKGGRDGGGERKRLPPKPTGKLHLQWLNTCTTNLGIQYH